MLIVLKILKKLLIVSRNYLTENNSYLEVGVAYKTVELS